MKYTIILLFLFVSGLMAADQDPRAKVNLKDGTVIEGILLKINAEGVELDPDGAVKWRFVPAEKLKSVELIDQKKIIEFPLSDASLPTEVKSEHFAGVSLEDGFPRFLALGSVGYASVGGKYYEGFNAGSELRLGVYYYFADPVPTSSRVFLGFAFAHASLSGDMISGLEPKLNLNEYGLEVGVTTRRFEGGHYLYLLVGLTLVSNEVSVPIQSMALSISESKAAIRMEGGASFYLGGRLSLLFAVGYDAVVGEKKATNGNSYVYQANNPGTTEFAGGILNFSLGLSYGLGY